MAPLLLANCRSNSERAVFNLCITGVYKNVLHCFWTGPSMLLGGSWAISLAGLATPLMTAGGVIPIGRRTVRG